MTGTGVLDAEASRPPGHHGDALLPELLRRSALGDEGAFAELYPIAAPRLFGLALRVLRDRDQAEEVIQEAFMVIWSTGARFDPDRGSALSWMLTIAHRRAVDRVRSADASSRRDQAWATHLETTVRDSTAESGGELVEAAVVRQALRALSPKQRTAVFLAYFHGLTYVEVATSLGIPAGTAKSRIRDGLRALSDLLAPEAGASLARS